MTEYVNRQKVIDALQAPEMFGITPYHIELIKQIPTADVVKVTRCKDCRHHSAAAGVCNLYLHFSVGVTANDYCSFGERRTV